MDIVVCIDNNFVMQCVVFLSSLFVHHKNVTVHVVGNDISEINKKSIESLVSANCSKVFFYSIDETLLRDFPIRKNDHVSVATYYRIFLAALLPSSLTKVLYVDCDMLVVDSLTELWQADIAHYAMAAIPDVYCNDSTITNRLGYDANENYYNAGVLLINLEWWKAHDVMNTAIAFICENPSRCRAHDQDALNAVLHGTIKTLSAIYNVQDEFLLKDFSGKPVTQKHILSDIASCYENPHIIHFTGLLKPWKIECYHPYRALWQFFQNRTAWKDAKKTHAYKGTELFRWYRRKLFEFFHLIKPKTTWYKACAPKCTAMLTSV